MHLSPGEVLRIAELARLDLAGDAAEALARDLEQVLSQVELLQGADTEGVQAVEGIGAGGAPLAPDHGPPVPLARSADAFAPALRDGFFLVPRLATHRDAGGQG